MAEPGAEFPELKNDAILKAARGEKPHRIPIWVMRQAGRYLPEFREVRKEYEFFDLVNNPKIACEVTLQPIRRYDLDAAIIFSDILVIPSAIGLEVKMVAGIGPVLPEPLETPKDLSRLKFDIDVTEKMKGTLEAITMTRHALEGKVPLLGFTGAPWTLMSYMIEGGGSRTLTRAKSWLYKYPDESLHLLNQLAEIVVTYLVEQVKAGAQMLQVFESHADLLGPDTYRKFCIPSLAYIQKETVSRLTELGIEPVPMTIFAKGAHYAIKETSELGYNVMGLDWTIDPKVARELAIPNTVFQGNMDPVALFGNEASIQANVKAMIERMGTENFICNLGHGIYPETPTEGVRYFIEAVHSIKLD